MPESRQDKLYRLSVQLQETAFFVMSFLVALTFLMTNLLAILWQSSDWLVGAVLPGVVATLTNDEREKYNVAPLSRSAVLDAAAQMKAEHMAAERYFAHESPGGITPWYWFEQAGYVYAYAGENLAIHFQDSDEVVKAWMNSPTHKANVVGPQYTEIGIGTAKGEYQGYPTVFVVQLFGTPAKRPVVVLPPLEVVAVAEVALAPIENESSSDIDTDNDTLAITQSETGREVSTSLVTQVLSAEIEDEMTGEPILQESYGLDQKGNEGSRESLAIATDTPTYTANDITSASFVATSSGLVPYLQGQEFVAGTATKAVSTLATQPRTVLQIVYMLIGGIVVVMLTISIILGYKTHHVRTVLIGVGLLLLMSLLFVWHIAITGGAVVV